MTKKKNLFDRGFKTKAEKLSDEYRQRVGVQAWEPLCAFELAKHMEILVVSPFDIFPSENDAKKICGTSKNHSDWSALVTENEQGKRLIVHNNYHSLGRQQSNIMHEIAHIICGHTIPETYKLMTLPTAMVYKNQKQEAEAEFLGAALQISKACLFWSLKRNMTHSDIAKHFVASEEMVKYRMHASGVAKQVQYMKKK